MCRACEAAFARRDAARRLLATAEAEIYGIRPALRKVFTPAQTGPEWRPLLRALDIQRK